MNKKRLLLALFVVTASLAVVHSHSGTAVTDLQAQEPIAYGIESINLACWPVPPRGNGTKQYAFVGQVFSDMQGDEQENRVEGVWVEGIFTADCTKKTSSVGAFSDEWGLADVMSEFEYRRGCTVRWDITSIESPPGYVYDPDLSVAESVQGTCH